jgi:hypothetical protein
MDKGYETQPVHDACRVAACPADLVILARLASASPEREPFRSPPKLVAFGGLPSTTRRTQ